MAALELLRGNKGYYDLVITDVQMPDMDGFKLLEIIGLEMDLPVISKSTNVCYRTLFCFVYFLTCCCFFPSVIHQF